MASVQCMRDLGQLTKVSHALNGGHVMPSPFPGMNPYLERQTAWDSFHPHFIAACLDRVAEQLGPEYIVRIESRLYIHELPAEHRFVGSADLGVSTPPRAGTGTGVIAAPQ